MAKKNLGRGPTEMELRVAQAIAPLAFEIGGGRGEAAIQDALVTARTAIRVLLEPTPSMIEAGCCILRRRRDLMDEIDATLGKHAIAVAKMRLRWRAMIESAAPSTKLRAVIQVGNSAPDKSQPVKSTDTIPNNRARVLNGEGA